MNKTITTVKRALISVSNKEGLVEFAQNLRSLGIDLISTGGTSQVLREAKIEVQEVEDLTGFPEMMEGRVKTLHPIIHGGILGKRDQHREVVAQQGIPWIDLVVVNLYPFSERLKDCFNDLETAIENIDIGGSALIRAAAKNMDWVGVVIEPKDYQNIFLELKENQGLRFNTRLELAKKAFAHTATYDAHIYHYLEKDVFPEKLLLCLDKQEMLRYGENPHQAASAYRLDRGGSGMLSAQQHQGKSLSYNNWVDAEAAFACVREFEAAACVIIKHANPCGAAVAEDALQAFEHAWQTDPQSAFGGVVALNRPCTQEVAKALTANFVEVLLAPEYTSDALALLSQKPNLRVLSLDRAKQESFSSELKFISGGLLVQAKDRDQLSAVDLKLVTQAKPEAAELATALFAWQIAKHLKSNAIVLAKGNRMISMGAGQVSRIDAVRLALTKAAQNLSGSVLASDAFFPFRDSMDLIAKTGIRVVIQPGGSVRDEEVINACNEHGIAMLFTGKRCFRH